MVKSETTSALGGARGLLNGADRRLDPINEVHCHRCRVNLNVEGKQAGRGHTVGVRHVAGQRAHLRGRA